jgi:preprotein translocase subunit SecA
MRREFHLNHPPATREVRAERPDRVETWLERQVHRLHGRVRALRGKGGWLRRETAAVNEAGQLLAGLSDQELADEIRPLRERLLTDGFLPAHVADSFALVREFSTRILGLRHHDSQVMGGLVMLRGMVAEMETGEGKTLTATLTAATAALAGLPVHIISVNDYLTSRDAENTAPLYRALGLSVGCVVHGQTPQQRRPAYGCDITYATNKELVFDYLRDRLTLANRPDPIMIQAESLQGRGSRAGRLLMRGLHFAIVDEADSVLIDEARTPLIISGSSGVKEEREFLEQALDLAGDFVRDRDFELDEARRQILLTLAGRSRIEDAARRLGVLWSGLVRREGAVHQALTALHLFRRDEQYLVRDGKVQIIDEFTGRIMPDRSWEQGLHQLIELKEAVRADSAPGTSGQDQLSAFLPALPAARGHDRHGAGSSERAVGRLRVDHTAHAHSPAGDPA